MIVKNEKPKHLKKFIIYCFGVKLTRFTDSKKKFPLLSITGNNSQVEKVGIYNECKYYK